MLLDTYLSLETWKYFAREQGLSLFIFIFSSLFSGKHLSTHCFKYSRHLCVHFFSFFFSFSNFCIAPCHFAATKLLREISKRAWSIYFEWEPNKHIFVFTPSVGVEHFWVDLNRRHISALILVQEQCIFGWNVRDLDFKSMTSFSQGQQSLIKLNTHTNSL